ncbi:hypothetical protein DI041_03850 [Stenotrophomonas maltophilia]|uniref:hypothetical protein n=1 Tax=Stenotrophomonas maltophilia TaxID=40324 RepID=UPI0010AACC82|nr:hypothetical protein [Stenotrophomonas maltophilia]TIE21029.1 hypothetical protein DI034_02280 [Stenotrophomonas maltophilia]TIE64460.1 hypothetical protein DI041_03850 [Stenotrophomonas maltophilia]
MTTDNKTLAVDVLAVMDSAIETYMSLNREARSEEDHLLDIEDAQAARAAVAELIQIAMEFSDYVAVDHNDTSLIDRSDMWDRLGSAVSRVKGESA